MAQGQETHRVRSVYVPNPVWECVRCGGRWVPTHLSQPHDLERQPCPGRR